VYILRLTHKGPVQNYTALTPKPILKNIFKLTVGITWSHKHFFTYDHICHVLSYTTWNTYRNVCDGKMNVGTFFCILETKKNHSFYTVKTSQKM